MNNFYTSGKFIGHEKMIYLTHFSNDTRNGMILQISSIELSLPQRHQDTKNHKENLSGRDIENQRMFVSMF